MVGVGDLTLQHLGCRSRRPAAAAKNGLGLEAASRTTHVKKTNPYFLQDAKKQGGPEGHFQGKHGVLQLRLRRWPRFVAFQKKLFCKLKRLNLFNIFT
jgi:hypothetical protein